MSVPRLLAVTHESTRTGAPMNLLHSLRWIAANTSADVHVLALRNGALRHEFEMVAPTTVLGEGRTGHALELARTGLRRLGSRKAWKSVAKLQLGGRALRGFKPDVVYMNSLGSLWALPFLPGADQIVVHVHELQVALRTTPPAEQELLMKDQVTVVAASVAVADMLHKELGIPNRRIHVQHEFIDVNEVVVRDVSLRERERLRRSYRIPSDAAIVMGAGTVDWRKGPDLFIALACEVRRRTREPVHFVWVGGDLTGIEMVRLRSDLERSGADHVLFVGEQPDPLPWFTCADVFALTSREDPFPLVCLEHAALRHPIVTFRNGGIPELLDACGASAAAGVVDYLDIGAMAERVIQLLASDRERSQAGAALAAQVQMHHDVSVGAASIWSLIEQLVGDEGPGASS